MKLDDLLTIAEPTYKQHVKYVQFMEGLYDPPSRLTKGLDRWLFRDYLSERLVSPPVKQRRVWWYMPRNLSLGGLFSCKPLIRYFFWKVNVMKSTL